MKCKHELRLSKRQLNRWSQCLPTPSTLRYVTFDSHQRAQLANRLRRAQSDTRTHARRAAEARRSGRQLEEQKSQLVAANPSLANVDIHRKTEYLLLLLGVVAVYIIDVILFA